MYKVGMVGAGNITKAYYRAFKKFEDIIEVKAVCDKLLDRAESYAKTYKAAVYPDYNEMAQKEDLDIAIICLPHGLHADAAETFAAKGVNILIEKPMANTVEECDRIIRLAKRNNVKLMIGHLQRYFSYNKQIKKIIDSGELGELVMITDRRTVNYFTEERPKWFLDKKLAGGGIVMNYGAHSLDKICWLTGRDVEDISGHMSQHIPGISVEGDAQILLRLEGGLTALIAYAGYKLPYCNELNIFFTKGTIRSDSKNVWVSSCGGDYRLLEPEGESDPFVPMIDDFIKSIKDGSEVAVGGEYGKRIIQIIEKFYALQKSGK